MAKVQYTIAEAKASCERRNKTNPLSVNASYAQNECHIRARRDSLESLFANGYISEVQYNKMLVSYIAKLQDKYL